VLLVYWVWAEGSYRFQSKRVKASTESSLIWVWRLGLNGLIGFGLFGFVKFRGFEWIGFGDLVGLD
jgi:hypothetical protein